MQPRAVGKPFSFVMNYRYQGRRWLWVRVIQRDLRGHCVLRAVFCPQRQPWTPWQFFYGHELSRVQCRRAHNLFLSVGRKGWKFFCPDWNVWIFDHRDGCKCERSIAKKDCPGFHSGAYPGNVWPDTKRTRSWIPLPYFRVFSQLSWSTVNRHSP